MQFNVIIITGASADVTARLADKRNRKVAFNFFLSTDSIKEIKNNQVDNAKDLHVIDFNI